MWLLLQTIGFSLVLLVSLVLVTRVPPNWLPDWKVNTRTKEVLVVLVDGMADWEADLLPTTLGCRAAFAAPSCYGPITPYRMPPVVLTLTATTTAQKATLWW